MLAVIPKLTFTVGLDVTVKKGLCCSIWASTGCRTEHSFHKCYQPCYFRTDSPFLTQYSPLSLSTQQLKSTKFQDIPPSAMTRYASPRVSGNPANTSLNKICTEHDGHKHMMYKIKSPYAGAQGLRLDTCLGCGLKNQQDWYECLHCIRKRCQQDRYHPKESRDKMEFFDGNPSNPLPSPQYTRH